MDIEAAKEFVKVDKKIQNAVWTTASLYAKKDGRPVIEKTHIKKAISLVRRTETSSIKWFVTVSIAVLLTFATLQLGVIYTESTINVTALVILPAVVIIWVMLLSYIFRELL
jgi:hypothetical protein